MSKGMLVKYMFAFANAIFKKLQGGLGVAAIVTSAVFAAISGSSLANAAALGMILLPFMVEYGYPRGITTGMLAENLGYDSAESDHDYLRQYYRTIDW